MSMTFDLLGDVGGVNNSIGGLGDSNKSYKGFVSGPRDSNESYKGSRLE